VSFAVARAGWSVVLSEDFMMKFTASGRLAWGGESVAPDVVASLNGVAIQPGGQIIVGGEHIPPAGCRRSCTRGFGLERFLPNGKVDRSFGYQGQAWLDFGRSVDDVALRGGKVVAVGASHHRFALVRFLAR
jgi:hypothetical protein